MTSSYLAEQGRHGQVDKKIGKKRKKISNKDSHRDYRGKTEFK